MPGLGGHDLAARLSVDHPGLPVLYVTGYTEQVEPVVAPAQLCLHLQKPFSGRALIAAASRLLATPT